MQVVLLAAGDGGRLLPLTAARPKALVEVAGTPLIDRIVDAFVEAGASEFVVVLGYHGEQIRDHLQQRRDASFRFAWNPDPSSGSSRSLLHGTRQLPAGPFLLGMGDHLVSPDTVARALAISDADNYVFVDSRPLPGVVEEATLLRLDDDGIVLEIGKGLAKWDAVDTGMFRLTHEALAHLERLPAATDLNEAWQELVADQRLRALDVCGASWADIDTEADLARAEAALREEQRVALEGPVSRLVNRRLSRPLARLAERAGLSPNQVTGLSTGVATAVPLLFIMNRPRLAGALIQVASVADGVDGDLARRTNRATQFGAVLDAVTDRYADAAILAGMTYWSIRHERKPLTGFVGLSALVGSLMVSYARARLEAETKEQLDPALRGHATRDVRLAVAAAGSASRQVYPTLVALAVLTNLSVAHRLARLYRSS